jgi:hypothetical protein
MAKRHHKATEGIPVRERKNPPVIPITPQFNRFMVQRISEQESVYPQKNDSAMRKTLFSIAYIAQWTHKYNHKSRTDFLHSVLALYPDGDTARCHHHSSHDQLPKLQPKYRVF